LFLEHQGVFQNQVVVPLDAHLELYKALKQSAEEMGDEVSFRRTDLALFDLDPASRVVTCRLVEVKCYSQVGDVAAYAQLKASIADQIAQSEHVLAYHFDPRMADVDRPDRPIKNRDLAALLGFYLDRSERYGVVLPEAAEEAHYFLRRLDERPYTLQFTRSAVVFDFSKPGTEPAEHENGIEFYRIGSDLIRQLVESAVTDTETVASVQYARSADTAREVTQELLRRRELAPAVPTFETAAFLSPPRDRTLAWDDSPRVRYTQHEVVSSVPVREPEPAAVVLAAPLPVGTVQAASTDTPPLPVDEPVRMRLRNRHPHRFLLREEAPQSASVTRPQTQDGEATDSRVAYDIMLGATGATPQYGLIGEVSGRKVALDLNQTHTISLFGVQGGGKSYTLGSVAEMASLQIPGINCLPEPLSTVIFHYSPTMDYKPEFTSMVGANSVEDQVRAEGGVWRGAEGTRRCLASRTSRQDRRASGRVPRHRSTSVAVLGFRAEGFALEIFDGRRRQSNHVHPSDHAHHEGDARRHHP
jgi:hypothetical protein